jgi:hypothetical protein
MDPVVAKGFAKAYESTKKGASEAEVTRELVKAGFDYDRALLMAADIRCRVDGYPGSEEPWLGSVTDNAIVQPNPNDALWWVGVLIYGFSALIPAMLINELAPLNLGSIPVFLAVATVGGAIGGALMARHCWWAGMIGGAIAGPCTFLILHWYGGKPGKLEIGIIFLISSLPGLAIYYLLRIAPQKKGKWQLTGADEIRFPKPVGGKQDPVLGAPIRTYRADINCTIALYIIAVFVAVVFGGIAVSLQDEGVEASFVLAGIGVLIASLFTWVGIRNSKNRLQIFERGIRILSPKWSTDCFYSEIQDVGVTNKHSFTFPIKFSFPGNVLRAAQGRSPVMEGPEVWTRGLLIHLHNGETLEARINSPKRAGEEILFRKQKAAAFPEPSPE